MIYKKYNKLIKFKKDINYIKNNIINNLESQIIILPYNFNKTKLVLELSTETNKLLILQSQDNIIPFHIYSDYAIQSRFCTYECITFGDVEKNEIDTWNYNYIIFDDVPIIKDFAINKNYTKFQSVERIY